MIDPISQKKNFPITIHSFSCKVENVFSQQSKLQTAAPCHSFSFCAWIKEKACVAWMYIKEKVVGFFSWIFCGCCRKTSSASTTSPSTSKPAPTAPATEENKEIPVVKSKEEKFSDEEITQIYKQFSEQEQAINNLADKVLTDKTMDAVVNQVFSDTKTPELKIDYHKKGDYIFVKSMNVSEKNSDHLTEVLEKILQKEQATGFILDNLAYGILFKAAKYDTKSSVLYYPDQNGPFEQLIDKLLAKGEDAYPSEKQKGVFYKLQVAVPERQPKDLGMSFVSIPSSSTSSKGSILSLSDILELVYGEVFEELKKIPLNGREFQKGGLFYPAKK